MEHPLVCHRGLTRGLQSIMKSDLCNFFNSVQFYIQEHPKNTIGTFKTELRWVIQVLALSEYCITANQISISGFISIWI